MGAGYLAQGIAKSFSNYLTTERQRQRQLEDQNLDHQMRLIQALAERPDFDPELVGAALHDLTQLNAAKQKTKGKGMLNKRDLPMSQFLQGIMSGTTPVYSKYAETQTELPSVGMAGYTDAPTVQAAQQGFTGQGVLQSPVPVPPPTLPVPSTAKNLASAGQQMQQANVSGQDQPIPHVDMSVDVRPSGGMGPRQVGKGKVDRKKIAQGFLRSPEEMAREEGRAAGIKTNEVESAKRDAMREYYHSIGMTDEEIKQKELTAARGTPAKDHFSDMVAYLPNGDSVGYVQNSADGSTWIYGPLDPNTGESTLIPYAVPAGAIRRSIGSPYRTQFETNDQGKVSGIGVNAFVPNAPTVNVDTSNLRGRTSQSINPSGLTSNQTFNALDKLQERWRKNTATPQAVITQNQLMQEGMKAVQGFADGVVLDPINNPAHQMVLVTFQKMLDPISVVREQEYARSAVGQPFLNRLEGYINRINQGGAGMTVGDLKAFALMGNQMAAIAQRGIEPTRRQLEALAKQGGFSMDQVTGGGTGLPDYSNLPPVGGIPQPPGATPNPPTGTPGAGYKGAGPGTKIMAPDGTTRIITDPAFVQFLLRNGGKVVK